MHSLAKFAPIIGGFSRMVLGLLALGAMALTGCQTLESRGDFRVFQVPEPEGSYRVVVETISDVIVFTDYDAMEPLVVQTWNEAGLPAIRMFEEGETSYYLYVFLQRTDEAAGELTRPEPDPFAMESYRYVRGRGLQPNPEPEEEPDESGREIAPFPGNPKLAVLFAVFREEDLDRVMFDTPPPQPMMDGLFYLDLDGEYVLANELREVTRLMADRILKAQAGSGGEGG